MHKRVILICAGVLAFIAISAALARFLSVENVERDALERLVQAEARGDETGMLALLDGCRYKPSCVASVRANARMLRRAGAAKILSVKSRTSYSLTGSTGKTRLAWIVIGRRPVVQCVQVSRSGNALAGIDVRLLSLSAPIPGEADC
jgi:hypothetical protein